VHSFIFEGAVIWLRPEIADVARDSGGRKARLSRLFWTATIDGESRPTGILVRDDEDLGFLHRRVAGWISDGMHSPGPAE
jgi:hypothetical protein